MQFEVGHTQRLASHPLVYVCSWNMFRLLAKEKFPQLKESSWGSWPWWGSCIYVPQPPTQLNSWKNYLPSFSPSDLTALYHGHWCSLPSSWNHTHSSLIKPHLVFLFHLSCCSCSSAFLGSSSSPNINSCPGLNPRPSFFSPHAQCLGHLITSMASNSPTIHTSRSPTSPSPFLPYLSSRPIYLTAYCASSLECLKAPLFSYIFLTSICFFPSSWLPFLSFFPSQLSLYPILSGHCSGLPTDFPFFLVSPPSSLLYTIARLIFSVHIIQACLLLQLHFVLCSSSLPTSPPQFLVSTRLPPTTGVLHSLVSFLSFLSISLA